MNKRIIAALVCCIVVLSLSGCDEPHDSGENTSSILSITESTNAPVSAPTSSSSEASPVESSESKPVSVPEDESLEGYEYEHREDKLYITKIPDVESLEVITKISDEEVYGIDLSSQTFDKLKQLLIPSGIHTICDSSFYRCDSIESVTIEEGLKVIGNDVFMSCTNLKEIVLPDSVEEIGNESFMDANVKQFRLPKNIHKFGTLAASGIDELIVEDCVNYEVKDGFIMSKDGTEMLRRTVGAFDNNKLTGRYEIPEGVTKLGDCLFMNETDLTEVIIPSSVTSIGYMTFAGCKGITHIELPNNLKTMGALAFAKSGLTEITLPILDVIPESAFMSCSALTAVSFKENDGPVRIESMAFSDCPLTGDVRLPSTTSFIGQDAFKISSGTIYIPDTLLECYDYCISLKKNSSIEYCEKTYETCEDFVYAVKSRARNTPEDGAVSMVNNDITKGDIVLLGETYHIGDTFKTFIDTGWETDDLEKYFEGDIEYKIESDNITRELYLEKHNCSITARFINCEADSVSLADCTLAEIEFTAQASNGGSFDGVTAGKSLRSDVVNRFGNPDEAYHPLEMPRLEEDESTCVSFKHTYEYDKYGDIVVEFEFGDDNSVLSQDHDPSTPVYKITIKS